MAGSIINGQQWEHCNCCGLSIRIQDLLYGVPSPEAQRVYWTTTTPWVTSGQKIGLCRSCVPPELQR